MAGQTFRRKKCAARMSDARRISHQEDYAITAACGPARPRHGGIVADRERANRQRLIAVESRSRIEKIYAPDLRTSNFSRQSIWMKSLRTKTKQAIDPKLISLFVDASASA
jgi:hypothetical protein